MKEINEIREKILNNLSSVIPSLLTPKEIEILMNDTLKEQKETHNIKDYYVNVPKNFLEYLTENELMWPHQISNSYFSKKLKSIYKKKFVKARKKYNNNLRRHCLELFVNIKLNNKIQDIKIDFIIN
jgi:hypothetical protein